MVYLIFSSCLIPLIHIPGYVIRRLPFLLNQVTNQKYVMAIYFLTNIRQEEANVQT